MHRQDGEEFVFAGESFRHFRLDPASGFFLDRLVFLTRPGTLWGLSAGALSRIAFRVATDETWQPDSDTRLMELLEWSRPLAEQIETPDVLRLFAATPERGEQVLMVGR